MFKKIKILFALLLVAVSGAAECVIHGHINGKNSFGTLNVTTLTGDFITTAVISPDSKFSLSLDVKRTDCYILEFSGNGAKRQIYAVLSPNDKITLNLQNSYTDLVISEVKGSHDMQIIKTHQEKAKELYKSLRTQEVAYGQTTDAEKRAQIQKEYYDTYNTFCTDIERYYVENKSHLASLLMAYMMFNTDAQNHKTMFKTLYESLNTKYSYTSLVKEVENMVTNPIEIGKIAPEIEGVGPDGRTIKLSDYRGKYVLIDFWASWCRPCRAENPNVVEAYNKFKNKKFTVFSVSLDADETSWKNAIASDGLLWTSHVCTFKRWGCPIAQKYRVKSIPFSVLIGPDGKVIAVSLRGERLQTTLEGLIK